MVHSPLIKLGIASRSVWFFSISYLEFQILSFLFSVSCRKLACEDWPEKVTWKWCWDGWGRGRNWGLFVTMLVLTSNFCTLLGSQNPTHPNQLIFLLINPSSRTFCFLYVIFDIASNINDHYPWRWSSLVPFSLLWTNDSWWFHKYKIMACLGTRSFCNFILLRCLIANLILNCPTNYCNINDNNWKNCHICIRRRPLTRKSL